jgi:hypothetical protein
LFLRLIIPLPHTASHASLPSPDRFY